MTRANWKMILYTVVIALAGCEKGGPDTDPAPVIADTRPADARFDVLAASGLASAPRTRCVIDRINGQRAAGQIIAVDRRAKVRFNGWVSDPSRHVPERFHIVLSNGSRVYGAPVTAGRPRPDVARTLKADTLGTSGFDVLLDLGPVPAGTYVSSITMDVNGATARCVTQTRVVVGR